jgi:hypothetical protein
LQVDRQLIERADVASELSRPVDDRDPAVQIPQIVGGRDGQPVPPEPLLDGVSVLTKAAAACRSAGTAAVRSPVTTCTSASSSRSIERGGYAGAGTA